ncbi:acyltransferase family protein [Rhizobium leguminosarum]|uniref:acyltransferase family protein n=1 Tax=Rhizobium leguminosarum TaxID=384 RepID=UPI001C974EC2|nr:acyltransferase family protein [Rhizobium leguminosarum]MBY5441593.1 acyltransferase [Rhizobium leguminosarum]
MTCFLSAGFLIIGIILDRQQPAFRFLRHFYLRRVLRIVPSYLALVVLFWSAVYAGASNAVFNADTPLWRHLTFTQKIWMATHEQWGPGGISVTWSVAIEEQFYLIFPFVILFLPKRMLLPMLALVAGASIIYRSVGYFAYGSVFTMYVHAALMVLQRARLSPFCGVMIALETGSGGISLGGPKRLGSLPLDSYP